MVHPLDAAIAESLRLEVMRINGKSTVNRVFVTEEEMAEDVESVKRFHANRRPLNDGSDPTIVDAVQLVALQRCQYNFTINILMPRRAAEKERKQEMSYKCQACLSIVEHGKPLQRWNVLRADRTIAREVPVCEGCLHLLQLGIPLVEVIRRQRPPELEQTPARIAQPKLAPPHIDVKVDLPQRQGVPAWMLSTQPQPKGA